MGLSSWENGLKINDQGKAYKYGQMIHCKNWREGWIFIEYLGDVLIR